MQQAARSQSVGRRAIASPYVCISCQYRRANQRFQSTSRKASHLQPGRAHNPGGREDQTAFASGRHLHQSQYHRIEQQAAAQPSNNDIPEYSFSVKPGQVKVSSKSQIRRSLRAWSTQNEQDKHQKVLDNVSAEGRLVRLPSSLFIGSKEIEKPDTETYRDANVSNEQDDDDAQFRVGDKMKPGTLTRHDGPSITQQKVVYLGDIGLQSLLLLSDGSWVADKFIQARMVVSLRRGAPVPNFLTQDEVAALRAHLPKQDVTRAFQADTTPVSMAAAGVIPENVVAPILRKLKAFEDAEQLFLRNHKVQLEKMYTSLAHPSEWRKYKLSEVSRIILSREYNALTDAEKSAFVEYANTFHSLFIAASTAETLTYIVGPKDLDSSIKQTQRWARQYQESAAKAALGKDVSEFLARNPLSSFIEKARRIILKSRKIRLPTSTGILGPVKESSPDGGPEKMPTGEVFTADDRKIISYLWDVGIRRPQSATPWSHACLIVRAIGAYPNMQLNQAAFRLLLQELGCVDPWVLQENLNTSLPGTRVTVETEKLWEEAKSSVKHLIDRKRRTTFVDTMAGLRKDWGSMEAFSIDGTNTKIREDAFSVEPANEVEDGYWFHVHMSHPTAHIELSHPIVQHARKRGAAYYGMIEGENALPMMPAPVCAQFSLTKNSPVLTVSTLLTTNGQVHDVKIAAGILRNVIQLNREFVASFMDVDVEEASLVVGKMASPRPVKNAGVEEKVNGPELELLSQHLPKLQFIQELLTARRLHRLQEVDDPAHFPRLGLSASVKVNLPERLRVNREYESHHWSRDPGITIRGNRNLLGGTFEEVRANDIVTQAMRLAGESCGKWFADRQIPAVFLGNDEPQGFSVKQLNEEGLWREVDLPVFTRTDFPRRWYHQNIQQYCGCSSPLRRFVDLIAHYQIDSYLRAEAQGLLRGQTIVQDDSVLAFSRANISDYLASDMAASDAIDEYVRDNATFWCHLALFRAFHFKEVALPEVMEVIVTSPIRRNLTGLIEPVSGLLIPWGVQVALEDSPERFERAAKFREILPIKLLSVNPSTRKISAVAVGLPSTVQQILEPIECHPSGDTCNKPVAAAST